MTRLDRIQTNGAYAAVFLLAFAPGGCAENGTGATNRTAGGDGTPTVDQSGDLPSPDQADGRNADVGNGHPESSPAHAVQINVQLADRNVYDEVLRSHRGKIVLVDFWATWCVPCVKQFPHTVEVGRNYADRGVAVVSVSMDDPESQPAVIAFLRKHGADFDNLLSRTGASEEAFAAFEIDGGALPHYKLYDRTGELRYTFGVDPTAETQYAPEDIERSLQALLDE